MRNMCKKPKTQREQIGMLWDACFNHIPTKLDWLDKKVAFIMVMMALILALMSVLIIRGG